MKIILKYLGYALFGVLAVLVVLTYFVISAKKGVMTDYWGRELYETFFLLKMVGVSNYPGILWSLFDFVVFFVLGTTAYGLSTIKLKEE